MSALRRALHGSDPLPGVLTLRNRGNPTRSGPRADAADVPSHLAHVPLVATKRSRPVSSDAGAARRADRQPEAVLEVGGCLGDLPPDGQISGLPLVPCDEPHHGEVYAEFTSTNSTFSDASLSSEAERLCAEAFSPFVGTSIERSNYTIALLVPTASGWARGDREITCIATRVDGSATIGSAKGSRA